jgi:predicted PurR-regulated permease PerM
MPRSVRSLLTGEPLILIALVLLALYVARPVLIPLAMALTLNFLLAPAVVQIEKLHIRRVPAVLLVVTLATVLVGILGWVVARQVFAVVNDLPNYSDNIQAKLDALHSPAAGPISHTLDSINEIGAEISNESTPGTPPPELRTLRERAESLLKSEQQPMRVTVVPAPQTTSQYLALYFRPALERLGALAMILVFTIYMLLKREDLRNRFLLLAGISRLNLMTQALNEAAARISRYLVMNVLVNIAYGIIFGIGLFLLHIPNATLWGVLMAILRMVPYVGTMIAGLSTLAFALAAFNGWWHPLWVLLLFAGLELVIANFAEPYIYGRRTGISAFALVVMAIVWTMLWGWPGLIVSTPLTVCLIVLGRHVPQMAFLHILLGEGAELSPEAGFYERLIAMDQPEAHAIADRFLKNRALVQLYDEVVLPALILSEQDRHKGVLDDVRSTWLYQSATELIAELTDYKPSLGTLPACDPGSVPERASPVVCIPGNDQADEIAGMMLAQLLEQCGHRTLLLSTSALSPEIMSRLSEDPSTILCISAVPPFAFAQARRLALILRQNLPNNPIMVGLWGSDSDLDVLRDRFGNARPDAVAATLDEALATVRQIDGQPIVEALR